MSDTLKELIKTVYSPRKQSVWTITRVNEISKMGMMLPAKEAIVRDE